MTWQLSEWLLFGIFADFGQVKKLSSYFDDFRQVRNLVVILLTLGKSKTW